MSSKETITITHLRDMGQHMRLTWDAMELSPKGLKLPLVNEGPPCFPLGSRPTKAALWRGNTNRAAENQMTTVVFQGTFLAGEKKVCTQKKHLTGTNQKYLFCLFKESRCSGMMLLWSSPQAESQDQQLTCTSVLWPVKRLKALLVNILVNMMQVLLATLCLNTFCRVEQFPFQSSFHWQGLKSFK